MSGEIRDTGRDSEKERKETEDKKYTREGAN
jgi:hypothetical protein